MKTDNTWLDVNQISNDVEKFSGIYQEKISNWSEQLFQIRDKNLKAVIWGAGSKGVTFLNTLKINKEIEYVVDLNPNKQGNYIAGTGQKFVSPEFLSEFNPDSVIVMNPIYAKEIQNHLKIMNLKPELMILE